MGRLEEKRLHSRTRKERQRRKKRTISTAQQSRKTQSAEDVGGQVAPVWCSGGSLAFLDLPVSVGEGKGRERERKNIPYPPLQYSREYYSKINRTPRHREQLARRQMQKMQRQSPEVAGRQGEARQGW